MVRAYDNTFLTNIEGVTARVLTLPGAVPRQPRDDTVNSGCIDCEPGICEQRHRFRQCRKVDASGPGEFLGYAARSRASGDEAHR